MKRKLRQFSPEHRKNISLSLIGRTIPLEVRSKISNSLRGRDFSHKHLPHTKEWKNKVSETMTGHLVSIETRNKLSVKLKGIKRGQPSDSHRRKLSLSLKGIPKSVEHRHNISLARKKIVSQIGFPMSPETLQKLKIIWNSREFRNKRSIQTIKLWQDPDYVSIQMRARGVKPNKSELFLQSILDNNFPGEWKYVGDGQLIIGGKCPDYTNINGKKELLDLFGTYWHKPEEIEPRKQHFGKYGYKLTIIWDSELKDLEKLIARISERQEEEA